MTLLHEVIGSHKLLRNTAVPVIEQLISKFIVLCIQLRKGLLAKEALNILRNHTQGVDIHYLEKVINLFIEGAEARVTEAQQKADQVALDVDDLEATETPENIILSIVSSEGDRERSDFEIVTPWLKFLWESYRNALDVVKNNSRLEALYHSVAKKAFSFCLRYKRRNEFRRLCDILRIHLSAAAASSSKSGGLNLNDPATLQAQMDTRFRQLNAAAELELWQEAFRTMEDLHHIINVSLVQPRPQMWVNYFEKMSRIFLVGRNFLFHSAALSRYFGILRNKNDIGAEELSHTATLVIMSAMSIPIINPMRGDEDNKSRLLRLSNLVRMPKPPTRDSLLNDAVSKGLLTLVPSEVRELYEILEVRFHPLQICRRAEPVLSLISKNAAYGKYVKPLHNVIMTRVLQQLAQVYSTMNIDEVVSLCSFAGQFAHPRHDIERFIMIGCKKREFSIRISHKTQTLHFKRDLFSSIGSADYDAHDLTHSNGCVIVERTRQQLSVLASKLEAAYYIVSQDALEREAQLSNTVLSRYTKSPNADSEYVKERMQLAEKKKMHRESEQARIAREESEERNQKMLRELESERARLKEEEARREHERLLQLQSKLKEEELARTASTLATIDSGKKISMKELEKLDKDQLSSLAEQKTRQAETERAGKLKALAKRVDHLERAYRKDELPLLESDYEAQKKLEWETVEQRYKEKQDSAKAEYERLKEIKTRLAPIMSDMALFRKRLVEQRRREIEKLKQGRD